MKPIISLILVLFCVQGFAQEHNYIPLLKKGNQWNVLNTSHSFFRKSTDCLKGNIDFKRTTVYKIAGDTLIDSLVYQKLIVSEDSLSQIWTEEYYLREDTLKQIVYLKDKTEIEIYNFNVKENDTLRFHIVNQITDTTINNIIRKKIVLSYSTWIEGIGDLMGIMVPYRGIPTCAPQMELLCMKNNDSILYKNENYSECFYWETTAITSLNNLRTRVYPNPVQDMLNIETSGNGRKNLEIIDLQGRIIMKQNFLENKLNLNIGKLQPGFYSLRISNDSHSNLTRIIKL